ncbi:MAG: tRNA 4-thiouridine(8) synthase ThiI, partial [Deltaproteobacteria bacterium]|nr:tRNA 4-thiouridine(8) synthase ThiI [Deltaproteobacteria bacterium]
MFNGILIRYGETFLKKGRRRFFLDVLRGNIERAIGRYEDLKLIEFHGYFLIVNSEQRSGFYPEMAGIEERLSLLKNIFGVSSYMPVAVASLKEPLEEIFSRGLSLVRQSLTEKTKTFRIDSSRSYKNFPLDSMEINREAGAYIQSATGLGVNLTSPDITLFINISKDMALLYTNVFRGAGGLPLGSSGRALLMLSGGIDSPVAGP